MVDIKSLYESQFLPARDPAWLSSYSHAVETAQSINESTFRSAAYQKQLWELDGVSSIGPGNSVTVPGAYADPEIVDALWYVKTWDAPADVGVRAKELDDRFNDILALVSPRHNARRPSARLVRIFAALRPQDVLCLMDSRRTIQFRQWLELPSYSLGFVGQHVISRQALREALGPERGLEDLVSYSQFSWFVWEQINAAETNTPPETQETKGGKATDRPKLTVLPARMQRKGMFYVANNLQLLMSIVRAAENGMEKEDLAQQIGEEAPTLNRSSRNNVLAQAVAIGLLSVESGTYRPTAAGRGLLERESAADMLVPAFIRTVFGFALLIDDVQKTPGLERGQFAKKAQSYYPRWTSEFAPNALVAWLRDLGLAAIDGTGRTARLTLTETGEYWASGLPNDLRSQEHFLIEEVRSEEAIDDDLTVAAIERGPLTTPSADEVVNRFQASPELGNYVFSTQQVRLVHSALHSAIGKRFILLAGLSGTGKTSMARAYARAYCEVLRLSFESHYLQIAVWPDWTDPSGLIGFVNPLTNMFNETPALRLLLAANRNPDKPYFMCLDEMNLARVEHYFAPFLSAMEGANSRLALHSGENAIEGIPANIYWPHNLFIIGTVNMDETTYPFSDKVLDRAFTFEFWDVDLDAWREKVGPRTSEAVLDQVFPVLAELYKALVPVRRHFGYRTCDEVLGFCTTESGLDLMRALDVAILAKVLPKIRGDSGGALPKALEDVAAVCAKYGLSASHEKLTQMQGSLAAFGAVRFWS
jgi:5-methylcytosine-specific restriction enzyme B